MNLEGENHELLHHHRPPEEHHDAAPQPLMGGVQSTALHSPRGAVLMHSPLYVRAREKMSNFLFWILSYFGKNLLDLSSNWLKIADFL